MSDSTDLAPISPAPSVDVSDYKKTRLAIAIMLEGYTDDKGKALELLERWERGVWACVHLNQPTATAAKEAFALASQEFLK